MATRREFLKTASGAFLAATGSPFLAGCAGNLATVRAEIVDEVVTIPKTSATGLARAKGLLKLRVKTLRDPILVRRTEQDELVALSLACTHRGCEVRPLPNAFECPCHGSTYNIYGQVQVGPARLALTRFQVEETAEAYIIKLS